MREKLLYLLLLIAALLIVFSCGKKGDPTLKSFEKPQVVKDIKAVHREDELIISWSYPSSEREKIKGFYIEKAIGNGQEVIGKGSEVKGQDFKNIVFLKSDTSQFIDKDFKTGKTYLYKIRVYSLRDVISDDSPVIKVFPKELSKPPVKLSYKTTNDSIEIAWQAIGNGQEAIGLRYNIYKSYEKGKYGASPLNNAPLKEPAFKNKIETEKSVYYTVRALLDTELKDEGYPSEELEINPESFVPSKPNKLKYVPSSQKVYIMWDENQEIWTKGYRIYRKKASETEFKLIGESILPAFTDNDPLSSKRSYYITAVGPKKESISSEIIEVHPLVER
ncbi:MAG: hypothetical protein HY957_05750 [Nitrospirae bacterium]|nr:hypothetical protein [Nitrospirota bacterium]